MIAIFTMLVSLVCYILIARRLHGLVGFPLILAVMPCSIGVIRVPFSLVSVYRLRKSYVRSCVCSESVIYKACEVRKYEVYSS